MQKVPRSVVWKDIIVPDSEWFVASETGASQGLEYAHSNYNKTKQKALELMKINREKFTLDKMTQKLDEILEKYTKDLPSQVSIKLPKLKKVVETA